MIGYSSDVSKNFLGICAIYTTSCGSVHPSHTEDIPSTQDDNQTNVVEDTSQEQIQEEQIQEPTTCPFEIPSTFQSMEEYEVGLGPDGEVFGYWYIFFYEEHHFEWYHSDSTESGFYTCTNNRIEASNPNIEAYYDDTTDILMWNNIPYINQLSSTQE